MDVMNVPTVLAFVSCVAILTHVYVLFVMRPIWIDTWKFYYIPFYCLSACAVALYWFMQPVSFASVWCGGLYSMFAAIAAWQWWNDHNDRRKRLAKKARDRVQQTEGGLKVVPESGHGR